jgi:hypothetical protein
MQDRIITTEELPYNLPITDVESLASEHGMVQDYDQRAKASHLAIDAVAVGEQVPAVGHKLLLLQVEGTVRQPVAAAVEPEG